MKDKNAGFESFSARQNKGTNLEHIFPESPERKKMTLVFACLSCLMCLAMIAISAGLRAGAYWGEAFEKSYVLELHSVPELKVQEQLETAKMILRNNPNVAEYNIVEGEELKKLMAPWLGDNLILDDLPLSRLIEIEMKAGNIKETLKALKAELIEIPGASIEAYHEAKAEYKAAGHAVRLISFASAIILIVIAGAVTAVSVESGVLDNKRIVSIMRLIGTENTLISTLFVKKLLTHAIKGALAGMLAALCVVAIISLIGAWDGLGTTFIFIQFVPGIDILFLIACVPLTISAVGFIAGRKTMNVMLQSFA